MASRFFLNSILKKRIFSYIIDESWVNIIFERIKMRRYAKYLTTVLILTLFMIFGLTGCSEEVVIPVTKPTVEVTDQGDLIAYLVEDFDKDYYSLSELDAMVREEVDSFVKDHALAEESGQEGMSVVSVEMAQDGSKKVVVALKFDSCGIYSDYFGTEAFFGTVADAQESGYDLYHIPLHVCSLFIPLLPAMSFYKGKHKDVVNTIACTVTISLMAFMTIYPNLIYGSWNIIGFFDTYFDFHTVFFHNVVIFEFILIIVLRLHHVNREKSYVKHVAIFGACFAAVAAIMSQLLKTNYANFYTCNIGPVNAFVESIKASLGYAVGQTIYVLILAALHVVFFIGMYYLYRAVDKLNIKLRGRGEE